MHKLMTTGASQSFKVEFFPYLVYLEFLA